MTKVTKDFIDWTSFAAFVEEFKNESDRAAVVLGAAKLDSILAQILDRFMLPSLSSTDELLEGDSPLATFSSRINACYRLGLISSEFAKSLHLVRKIRNSFAHETSGCSLMSGPHSDRIKALLLPLRPLPFFVKFRDHFFDNETLATDFRACLSMMAARLEARLHAIKPVTSDDAYSFIKENWVKEEVSKADEPSGSK
jgi:hypothetical protein